MNILERLPDPDKVGASEYRLVYDFVKELEDLDVSPLLIQASMDEISRWARKVLIEYTRATNTF